MEEINLDFADLYIFNDHTAMLEAHYGAEIDRQKMTVICSTIECHIDGNYSIISNRINSHSNDPIEIAQVLNQNSKVTAMAIIDLRAQNLHFSLEERLLDIPAKRFTGLSDALFWLETEIDIQISN